MSMIDLSVLQPVSWVAAAIGVCVAAFYYALNLRETTRNRRANFANSILGDLMSEEGALRWVDILSMKWDDFDDYVKKYDSAVNRENFAKRVSFWTTCESIGYQYRTGAIDLDTIYNISGTWILGCWRKFKPIIEKYRGWEWPSDVYSNWEYLSNALDDMQSKRDADYKRKMDVVLQTHADGLSK